MNDNYEAFVAKLESTYPNMFTQAYGGVAVGSGWYHIVEKLCSNIQHHIDWQQKTAEHCAKLNKPVPEVAPQVVVAQIKEKFGGLRFYYDGGDDYVSGLVSMADSWASQTCEQCGAVGKLRTGGWLRTLCDTHEAIRHQPAAI